MLLANIDSRDTHTVRKSNIYNIMGSSQVTDISRRRRMEKVPEYLQCTLQPGEVKLLYVKH